MTLTDIMPTLRGSLPDPLDAATWPAGTRTELDDVVVQGLSLARAARLLGTPLWFHPGDDPIGVVLLTVTDVTGAGPGRRIRCGTTSISEAIAIDAAEMYWHEARLVGRVSVARRRPATVTAWGVSRSIDLPDDLVPGDVIAAPARMSPATPHGCRLLDRIEESPAH